MTDPTPDVPTLRRLLAEATPGPWGWEATSDNDNGWCMGIVLDDRGVAIEGRVERGQGEVEDFIAEAPFGGVNGLADAALIVAAVNALPGILDRLEAAEGAVARGAEVFDRDGGLSAEEWSGVSAEVVREIRALGERAQRAEAKVQRIETLRDEYDADAADEPFGGEPWSTTADRLRAALAEVTP